MNTELFQFIWRNRNKSGFFKVILRKVYHRGTARQFSVYIQKNRKWIDISRLIAKTSGKNIVTTQYHHEFVVVPGCGMDMAFSMLHEFLSALSVQLQKRPCTHVCEAANSYILL